MLDFDALVLGPVYGTFGTPAALIIGPSTYRLSVVDYTKGIAVEEDSVGIQTIRPVVDVRRSTLVAINVESDDLIDAKLELNGANWRIKSLIDTEVEIRLILMRE